jgi:putative PIN family toxin of toxin-antitoxin system
LRAVIDTNVVVSRFISERSAPSRIFALLAEERFELVISPEIRDEYISVLVRPGLLSQHGRTTQQIPGDVAALLQGAHTVIPLLRFPGASADPKDDKFIEAAVAGEADVIVSGDRHLLELGTYEGIRILTPAAFLALIEMESG